MAIQSKRPVLLALIVLPACVSSLGTQPPSPIHTLEMTGSSRETAVVLGRNWSRLHVVHRDQYGDAPLLLNVVDSVIVDMDRNPSSTANEL